MVKTFTKAFIMLGIIAFFISLNISNVLGANPTITNLLITPNPAYSNSLLNCSAVYNDADSNKGNVTVTWYNDTTTYFSTNRYNIMTGENLNEPLSYFINDGSLVGCWKFSEMNGTNVSDCLQRQDRYGKTLTLIPAWNNTIFGGSMTFYGAIPGTQNNSLSIPKVSSLNFSQNTVPINYTITAWFITYGKNLPGYSSATQTIISDMDQGAVTTTMRMELSGANRVTCGINDTSTAYKTVGGSKSVINNTRYFASCVFNGTTLTLYVNGTKEGQVHIASRRIANSTTTNIRIGSYASSSSSYFNGVIDEVQIYNRSFEADEVLKLYTNRTQARGEVWNCSVNSTDSANEESSLYSTTSDIKTVPVVSVPVLFPTLVFADNNLFSYYNYSDVNGNHQFNSTSKWYRSTDGGTTYSLVNTSRSSGDFILLHLDGDLNDSTGTINATRGYRYYFVDGKYGKALKIDGGEYIEYNLSSARNLSKEFTIDFWIKLNVNESDLTANSVMFDMTMNDTTNRIRLSEESNRIRGLFKNDSTDKYIDEGIPYSMWYANIWHHITYTISPKKGIVSYRDGEFRTSNDSSSFSWNGFNNMSDISIRLGMGLNGNSNSNITIDEFRITNRYLTEDEVKSNYLRATPLYNNENSIFYLSNFNESDRVIYSIEGCNDYYCAVPLNSSPISIQPKKKANVTISFATSLSKINFKYGVNFNNGNITSYIRNSYVQDNMKGLRNDFVRIWVTNTSTVNTNPYINDSYYNYTELDLYINSTLATNPNKLMIVLGIPDTLACSGVPCDNAYSNISLAFANITRRYLDVCTNGSWVNTFHYTDCSNILNIAHYQIINEPSNDYYWDGNETNYTKIYNMSYVEIKKSNSNIKVGIANILGLQNIYNNSFYYRSDYLIKNVSLVEYEVFLGKAVGLDFIGIHKYGGSDIYYTIGSGDNWVMNQTRYLSDLANYITDKTNKAGFTNTPLYFGELNVNNPVSNFSIKEMAKPWYASVLNWFLRNTNITGEMWFDAQDSNLGEVHNWGLWTTPGTDLTYSPKNTSGTYFMKYYFVRLNVNGSTITQCSTSTDDIECLSIIKPSGAKGLTLINKAYAITDVNVTLDTSSGLPWDFQANNFISDINQTLSKYNVTTVGLQSGNFNLTEGQNTGLLDTNGNEITDDVNNVAWITSKSTDAHKIIGNNLSVAINATLTVNVTNCDFSNVTYISHSGTYVVRYTSPTNYSCSGNTLRINVSYIETATGSNNLYLYPSIIANADYNYNDNADTSAAKYINRTEIAAATIIPFLNILFLAIIFTSITVIFLRFVMPEINEAYQKTKSI